MKKALFIIVWLLALTVLCGCTEKEQDNMETTGITSDKTVTVINGVSDADVWILPDTEANRKTSLWGTATVSKIRTGESRQAPLCEPGDGGLYLLRMIDADGFYYSASGVTLGDGYTVRISENELRAVTAEVADENGVILNTYEVFSARL